MRDIPKTYDQTKEPEIYKLWESSGYFNPDNLKGEPFSMVLPPPNVTGTLHVGHAMMVTIEDIIIRFHRMLGRKTLWLPGTDHAAIATESKVEKDLIKKENLSRQKLGKEEFLKRVNKYALESQDTILNQLKKMGASLDWSRLAFTLDEKRGMAVNEAFIKMYEAGIIYHGEYLINWDKKGQTTVSDEEVEYESAKGTLYTFRYSKDFPIPIASTRPETKLGDVAVAVHPNGKWKKYIGEEHIISNFAGKKLTIKIVGDEAVETSFGTGAVGVTPAHSMIDDQIARRHKLPSVQVINEFGKIINTQTDLDGLNILDAREKIVEWLRSEGLLEKAETIDHNIAKAQRSGGVIEILPKRHQFFVNVHKPIASRNDKSLKELMHEAVSSGKIKIIPKRFEKIYFHWIDNLRDWNISRQVWYGHPIPAWYKDEEIKIGLESPGSDWKKIDDTFDTWFSSGLWTFSTLGWPKQTEDLKTYHPTDVLETGYDILFFWVARMILMSEFFLGEIPFKTVYLHGLVRDKDRQKMSKSKGNVVDPLGITDKYGVDALRMALVVGNLPGNDLPLSEDKVRGYRNFANKVWNVSRFVLSNQGDDKGELTKEDRAILDDLNALVKKTTKQMQSFDFAHAAEDLYHYFWHTFADKIIEESKAKLANESTKASAQRMLTEVLETNLRLLHPFMPFVTETIWRLTHQELLMIQKWPQAK
jgi:valyl-tRNA synthetase